MSAPASIPAKKIGSQRRKLGLSRKQLAEKVGVSSAAVGHWERGNRTPEGSARILLLRVLF